jgi:hypothetical protein
MIATFSRLFGLGVPGAWERRTAGKARALAAVVIHGEEGWQG